MCSAMVFPQQRLPVSAAAFLLLLLMPPWSHCCVCYNPICICTCSRKCSCIILMITMGFAILGGELRVDGAISTTGDQSGVHSSDPIATVTFPPTGAIAGSDCFDGEPRVLSLEQFLLRCCSETAHAAWLAKKSPAKRARAEAHWTTGLGMRHW